MWFLKENGQHRIEALPASAGRREALLVEGQKSALEQRREATTKQRFDVLAGGAFEPYAVNALGKAQSHHQHLFDRSVTVDRRHLFDPGSHSLNSSEPPLRGSVLPGREFASISGEPTVRPGADADVILVAPIGQVMLALGAGPRMIGDLVGRAAVHREPVLRRLEQCGSGL